MSGVVGRFVDGALEATVAGSFTSIGYRVRRRMFDWPRPGDADLAGRTMLVTGATSGLGKAAADALAGRGARVMLLGRDPARTYAAAAEIRQRTGNGSVEAVVADLADLSAVRAAADGIADRIDGLDVLVNNAGALTREYTLTTDGLELTYQTHVVAPYLLTHLLLPLLRAREDSRVVTVSSGGMYAEPLTLPVPMPADEYDGVRAYARAKRAQVVLNEQWAARTPQPPVFHAMHPGWADTPGVVHSLPTFHRVVGPFLRTPQEGADTIVWLASAEEPASATGRFWLDRRQRGTVYLPWTRSRPEQADALWVQVKADADLV